MNEQRIWVDRFLVATALALVGVVLYTGQAVTTSEVRSRKDNVFVAWRGDELASLTLERAGRAFKLDKQEADDSGHIQWLIADRANRSADAAAVDQLLSNLRFAAWVRKLDPKTANRAELGLNEPRRTLRLEMGSISYRVRLGKAAPAPGGAAYLAVTGPGESQTTLGIVKKQLVDALLVDEREFLGRDLVPYSRSAITRLELTGAGGKRHVVRDEHRFRFDNMWSNGLIDGQASGPLFFHLARLTAEPFLSPEQAEQALKQGETVELELWTSKTETPASIVVGGKCPVNDASVVAWRKQPDNLAGCVPSTVMAGLTLPADALLDWTPFSFSHDRVERLVTELGSQRLELVRNDSSFLLKAPVEAAVGLEQGNRRIETIVETPGEPLDAPQLADLGLAPPRGTMTIRGLSELENTAASESISLGKLDQQGRLPILRKADGQVLLLPPDAARAFEVDATLSRSLEVLDFEEDSLVSLQVHTPQLDQRLIRIDDRYQLESPADFDFDASLVSGLTASLRELRAERWVSDSGDQHFGLQEPSIRIVVETKHGQEVRKRTLNVGRRLPGGAYASVNDVPGVFVISSAALRAIVKPVLSRQAFVIDPSALERIVFRAHDRSVELTERAGVWVSDTPGVDAEHAAHLVEALSNLRPEFAVHTGSTEPFEGFGNPTLSVTLEPAEESQQPRVLRVGAAHSFRDMAGYYLRITGENATFAISQPRVQQLLDLL